jgi:hypothetical protein
MRASALALALAVLAAAPRARAEEEVDARCTLRVIHALPEEGGVDPQLAPLRARLLRPPFLFWKSFRLLSAQEKLLKPASTVEYQLPDGRKATLLYAEHALGPRGRHVVRGSFHLEGARSTARTMFALDEGGSFLVAGAKHQGGIIIYAVSCTTEK